MFAVSSVTFIGYDNIAVPRLTAEIWEHDDIAKSMGQVVLYTVIRTSLIGVLSSSYLFSLPHLGGFDQLTANVSGPIVLRFRNVAMHTSQQIAWQVQSYYQ